MRNRQVAVNYAKALFKAEGDQRDIQIRQQDLELIAQGIHLKPQITHMLACPEIPIKDRIEILQKSFEKDFDPKVVRLLTIILKRGLTSYLPQISSEYHKLVVHALNVVNVEVVSAQPFSEENRASLIKKCEERLKKKIDLSESVDPSLLGGFSLLVHNQMLDLSIKGQLQHLKLDMLKAKL